MIKFEVGKTYATRSIYNHVCAFAIVLKGWYKCVSILTYLKDL